MGFLHRDLRTRICRGMHLVAPLFFSILASSAVAGELPDFRLTFRDGAITPLETKVPADTTLKLVLVNEGDSPVEFESIELRKEKVVGPHITTFVVIHRLDAGAHVFFDDFHPDAPQARIVAEDVGK